MASVIDLFTKTKAERSQEKRAKQFLNMFSSVSHIMGISKGIITESNVMDILEKLGKPNDSSSVFISIILLIHSKRKQSGFITLMRIGNLVQDGSKENVLKSLPKNALESIFKMMHFITEDVEMYLSDVSDDITEEPLELFHSFRRHVLFLSGVDKSRFNTPNMPKISLKPKQNPLMVSVKKNL